MVFLYLNSCVIIIYIKILLFATAAARRINIIISRTNEIIIAFRSRFSAKQFSAYYYIYIYDSRTVAV